MVEAEVPGAGQLANWRGAFGEQWFAAVCASAGCSVGKPLPDVVRIDFTVHDHVGEVIRVQLKTTEAPNVVDDTIRYALDVDTYNYLREGNTPGYLVVCVMTAAYPGWTSHYGTGSVVRGVLYWKGLAGLAAVDNQATVTVAVPLANMLTPTTLLNLFP